MNGKKIGLKDDEPKKINYNIKQPGKWINVNKYCIEKMASKLTNAHIISF